MAASSNNTACMVESRQNNSILLVHLKADLHVELNTGHLYLDNSPVATKKLLWGMPSGKEGGGQQRTSCVLSPHCSELGLIYIALWGCSFFCHLVDCHQISSDMMHGGLMHREADTAGVWCMCVSFPVQQYTRGCHTNKVYNDWLVRPYRDLSFNRAETSINRKFIFEQMSV